MYTMNQLTIIGFTGNDADAHYTPSGTLVTTLSVATKESWKGRRWHLTQPHGQASSRLVFETCRIHADSDEGILRDGAGYSPDARV